MCRRQAGRNVPAVKITSTALIRLFRLAGPIVAGIVGLVFIVVGAALVASQSWESVTATANSCQTRIDRSGNPPSHRNHTTCVMIWRTAAGDYHSGTVDFRRAHGCATPRRSS
jgi:xanthosine utilization system XapX-like protein